MFMEIEIVVICMISQRKRSSEKRSEKAETRYENKCIIILILEGKLKTSTELEAQIQDCPKIEKQYRAILIMVRFLTSAFRSIFCV